MWFDKNESLYPASRVAFIFWEHARINCPEDLLRKHPNTASFVAPFLDHFIAETNKINLAEQKGQCKHCDTLFYQLWFFFTRILISTCLHA